MAARSFCNARCCDAARAFFTRTVAHFRLIAMLATSARLANASPDAGTRLQPGRCRAACMLIPRKHEMPRPAGVRAAPTSRHERLPPGAPHKNSNVVDPVRSAAAHAPLVLLRVTGTGTGTGTSYSCSTVVAAVRCPVCLARRSAHLFATRTVGLKSVR